MLDSGRCLMAEGVGLRTILDVAKRWMADDVGWQKVLGG